MSPAPQEHQRPPSTSPDPPTDPDVASMAAVAVGTIPASTNGGQVNKRYRPAPAKTFQCRGYGECRMVFSRSEHLARHIRKHTGERPFTCHCGKQFSRLDNLRQHAQTVHSDKQEQNEAMMRDLTAVHATMTAASKGTKTNGSRRPSQHQPQQTNGIKQESGTVDDLPLHLRPGTSSGYEGNHIYSNGNQWDDQSHHHSFRDEQHQHSFRDSAHSFRASSATTAAESFRPFTSSGESSFRPSSQRQQFYFSSSRPGTATGILGLAYSSSRPGTAGNEPLPPLSAVVSATLSPLTPSPTSTASSSATATPSGIPIHPQSTQHLLPLRRPESRSRPTTAPAFSERPSSSYYNSGSGGGAVVSSAGWAPAPAPAEYDESPFSFHPPPVESAPTGTKRAFDDEDGPSTGDEPAPRPVSRRLSVMDLCDDNERDGISPMGGVSSSSRPSTGTTATATRPSVLDSPPFSGSSSSSSLSASTPRPYTASTGFARLALNDSPDSETGRSGSERTYQSLFARTSSSTAAAAYETSRSGIYETTPARRSSTASGFAFSSGLPFPITAAPVSAATAARLSPSWGSSRSSGRETSRFAFHLPPPAALSSSVSSSASASSYERGLPSPTSSSGSVSPGIRT